MALNEDSYANATCLKHRRNSLIRPTCPIGRYTMECNTRITAKDWRKKLEKRSVKCVFDLTSLGFNLLQNMTVGWKTAKFRWRFCTAELVELNKGKVWRNDVELKLCTKAKMCTQNDVEGDIAAKVLWSVLSLLNIVINKIPICARQL